MDLRTTQPMEIQFTNLGYDEFLIFALTVLRCPGCGLRVRPVVLVRCTSSSSITIMTRHDTALEGILTTPGLFSWVGQGLLSVWSRCGGIRHALMSGCPRTYYSSSWKCILSFQACADDYLDTLAERKLGEWHA